MNNLEVITMDDIKSAEKIAVTDGENSARFRQIFEIAADLELPTRPAGKLWAKAGGQEFFFLRNMDIPARITEGDVDIGVFGTDAEYEYEERSSIISQTISNEEICRFSVLTAPQDVDSFRQLMSIERRFAVPTVWLPTSLPTALEYASRINDFPFRACCKKIGGKVEAYARLLGVGAVADRVNTGNSAQSNELEEAFKIFPIKTKIGKRALAGGQGINWLEFIRAVKH